MHNQESQSCQHPNAKVPVPLTLPLVVHHIGLSVSKRDNELSLGHDFSYL